MSAKSCCCSCVKPIHRRADYGEKCHRCGKHRPPKGEIRYVDEPDGGVPTANSYVTPAEAKAYADDSGGLPPGLRYAIMAELLLFRSCIRRGGPVSSQEHVDRIARHCRIAYGAELGEDRPDAEVEELQRAAFRAGFERGTQEGPRPNDPRARLPDLDFEEYDRVEREKHRFLTDRDPGDEGPAPDVSPAEKWHREQYGEFPIDRPGGDP